MAAEQGVSQTQPGSLTPASTLGEPVPCSSAQRRLWFLQQLAPASAAAYNVTAAFRIRGTLDRDALARAMAALMTRQDALRTRIVAREGEPWQEVVEAPQPPLRILPPPAATDPAHLDDLVRAELDRVFDPAQAPMWQVALVPVGPQDHLLALSASHLVCDGWSLGLLLDELAEHYSANCLGQRFEPAPLPVRYADFAAGERARRADPAVAAELDRWAAALAGLPATAPLPDLPRPPIQRFRGARVRFPVPPELTDAVAGTARRLGATASMCHLAAYLVLMARSTGTSEVVIGMPVAGRDRLELESVIGFFAGTVPVRCSLTGRETAAEVVAAAREATQRALQHQHLPFEELVERLQPTRDTSVNPVFQSFFAYQNTPVSGLRLSGLLVEPLPVAYATSKFDLMLELVETGDGAVRCDIEYNEDLYLPATAEQFASHYLRTLEWITSQEGQSVGQFPLATDQERRQWQWQNRTEVRFDGPATLAGLLAAQADRTPSAPCLVSAVSGAEALDYRELRQRAEQLAGLLQLHGAGPDQVVAVCLPRSVAQVVALVATVTGGSAYLPLDSDHPVPRLRAITDQARPRALVTTPELAGVGLVEQGTPVVVLDEQLTALDGLSTGQHWPSPHPDHLAYVIFTSGSTGTPKGVMVSHRAIVNRLAWMQSRYQLRADDRVLQKTPSTFDVSVWEYFWPLITGAQLVVAAPDAHRDPVAMAATIAEHRVSILHFVPTMLAEFLAADLPALPSLRAVFSSGEALDVTLAQRLRERLPTVGLHNLYGPTEAAVDVTYHDYQQPTGRVTVPIGQPVANTTVYVRDGEGELVPTGVPGELHLGGVQLARGYLGRPDLTAAAFVPDPYGLPGARLYRTGDLVRWQADGELEYLDRIDHQVKIRGLRVELGEIETVLRGHPEVADAVAAVCELPDRGPTLVGYVTLSPTPSPAAAEDNDTDGSIDHWQAVWEHVYAAPRPATGPDFAGWVSSYTGQPVPDEQMARFVTATVDRIRTLGGKRLLEIGVGSGLLLHRLAPDLLEYWATDMSATAVRMLADWIEGDPALAARVKLLHRQAAELDDLPAGRFDGIILNSVVQYFPSADYLRLVLRRALRLVSHGGYVFLGDLRSARLLPAQHASVQAFRAPAGMTAGELAARIGNEVAHEHELAVDPQFLLDAVADCGPVQVGHALRAEADDTEMSRFRYDAVLRKGGDPPPLPRVETAGPEVEWPTLLAWLDRAEPLPLLLQAVPNSRAAEAVSLLAASGGDPDRPVTELQAQAAVVSGVEPNQLRQAATARGLIAAIGWSASGPPGTVDVLVGAAAETGSTPGAAAGFLPAVVGEHASGHGAATDPRRAHRHRRVEQALRTMLAERLPDSMAPSYLMLLDAFPVTSSGKVDRRRLPAPRVHRPASQGTHQAPATEAEQVVAQVWSDLTRVDRIGRQDNFFALGGDSILAVQVVSRLRERGLAVPLRVFFEDATVARVAAAAQPLMQNDAANELLPLTAGQHELAHPVSRRAGPLVLRAPVSAQLPQARLERAWRSLLRSQPGLRLRFEHRDGQMWQQLTPPVADSAATGENVLTAPAAVDALTGPAAQLTTMQRPDGGTDLVLTVDRLVAAPHALLTLGAELDALLADADAAGRPDREQAEQVLRQQLMALVPAAGHLPVAAPDRDPATVTPLGAAVCRVPAADLRHRLNSALTRFRCTWADLLVAALAGAWPDGGDAGGPLVRVERAARAWPAWLVGPDRAVVTVHFAAPPRSGSLLRSVKTQLRQPGPVPTGGWPRVLLVLADTPAVGGDSRWELVTPHLPDELLETYDAVVSVETDPELTVSVRCRPAASATSAQQLTDRYLAELAAVAELVANGDEPLYVADDFPVASLGPAALVWLGRHRPGLADVYPLTPFQQHATGQLADRPQDGLYTISTVFTLTGIGFDPAAFRRTWQVLMDRHAGLRTSFADLPGAGWHQLVHAAPKLPIDEQDLRALPAGQREHRVRELAVAARRHRFDLSAAPQWWMTILHLGEDDYRVVCLLSYALQDGWSFAVLQEEWFALYEAFRAGAPQPSLAPPSPMRDHVAWLLRQDADAARKYWREALRQLPRAAGVRATVADRSGDQSAIDDGAGAGLVAHGAAVALDSRLRYHATMVRLTRLQDHRMQAFARQHRLTVFTLLAASWTLTLSRATRSDTVAFGTVSSGRSPEVPGAERIFGPLNNILPVVWSVPTLTGLADRLAWLHELQHRHVAARAHDYAALPDLASWAGADRASSLVDNFLVFENFPRRTGLDDELRAWGPDGGETQTEHALRLLIWPSQPLTIHASYYRDMLDADLVEALLRGLCDSLAELVDPGGGPK